MAIEKDIESYKNIEFTSAGGLTLSIQMPYKLKVKKLVPEAVLPAVASEGDVGYDVVAIDNGTISDDGTYIEYKTGLAVELPKGFHIEIFPRSSISKYDLALANSIGLVDNHFRGELRLRFKFTARGRYVTDQDGTYLESSLPSFPNHYKKGDKIGQIVIRTSTLMEVVETDLLSETERGEKGFGSSGN